QPRCAEFRRQLMDRTCEYGPGDRRRGAQCARGHSVDESESAVLPGLDERNVRLGPYVQPGRIDAVSSAESVWCGKGVRELGDRQLSREPWVARFEWNPLQSRIAVPRHRICHSEGHRYGCAHQTRTRARI